jgi:hypothetical protein
MSRTPLQRQLADRRSDKEKLADKVIRNPDLLPEVIYGLESDAAAIKYGSAKILRMVSDREPALLYPWMDLFSKMLDSDNNIMRWEAIHVIASLTRVDDENKFEKIFDLYFASVPGPSLIAAANVIGGASTIALAKPGLTRQITAEILKVDKARYRTADCRRIALGKAIDSFDRFFDQIEDKDPVVALVRRQLRNPRNATRKRAERFLKKRGLKRRAPS